MMTAKAPWWLEKEYRFVVPYVTWPQNFSECDKFTLFIVDETAPQAIRHLVACYDAYWGDCSEGADKAFVFDDEYNIVGVKKSGDKDADNAAQLIWMLICRGDLPRQRFDWGKFELETYAECDKQYPGWREKSSARKRFERLMRKTGVWV